jgi:hypothetical protein
LPSHRGVAMESAFLAGLRRFRRGDDS